jgi:hypothetical protein
MFFYPTLRVGQHLLIANVGKKTVISSGVLSKLSIRVAHSAEKTPAPVRWHHAVF